jgi:prepilin-type N-terminal cleavage/methylation domain-containing protein
MKVDSRHGSARPPSMHGQVGRRPRGYTVIEVMIALTLLAIGTAGIIAMQKVTAVANRDAKNLVIANQIARTWIERLRADAVQWNHPSPVNSLSDLGDTRWLNQVTGQWFRPADDPLGSPTADAFGNDVTDANVAQGVFCTNVRLNWLYGPPPGAPPPHLIRAEVRVYWLRDGGGGVVQANAAICAPGINLALVSTALERYHFVYVTSAIAENMAR